MKYIDERNKKVLALLTEAKKRLPVFAESFFMGLTHTTQPLTRLNYAYDLGLFFDYLTTEIAEFHGKDPRDIDVNDLEKVETFHIEMFTAELTKTNKERGITRKLSALRSFFAYYFKHGDISKNVLPNVDLPKLHDKNIIRLDNDESKKIIETAVYGDELTAGQKRFHHKNGFRDTVILSVLLNTGCRVSELVGLNVGDVDMKTGSFRITRKGGNESILYMTDHLKKLVAEYIETISPAPKTVKQPPLPTPISGITSRIPPQDTPLFAGPNGKTRLGTRAVQNLVKKYAAVASPLKKISPHKLRSTFGTNLYRATGDIYAVADVLGHANVNTTRKHYAEITADVRKKAILQYQDDNPNL